MLLSPIRKKKNDDDDNDDDDDDDDDDGDDDDDDDYDDDDGDGDDDVTRGTRMKIMVMDWSRNLPLVVYIQFATYVV